jgi:ACR3 family arsenite efflux pump ArsB
MPNIDAVEQPTSWIEQVLARIAAGAGTSTLLVAAIIAGAALGHLSPKTGEAFGAYVDHTVLALVALLMFEVQFSELRRSWSNIHFLSITWMANFIAVPTIGFAIASFFLSGQPLFFTGLIIYFMAPCTDWFLGFTRLANGNTALGAVLLPINMITQLLLYPVYLYLFAGGAAPVDVGTVGNALLQWFLVPAAAAVLGHQILRCALPRAVFSRVLACVGYAVPFVIALLVLEIFSSNITVLVENASVFAVMLFAIFLFFVATFALGEVISKLAGFAYPEHVLLTMTTAARNAPMMLGVTMIAIPEQPLIYAAIIIGMLVEFPHLTALRQILMSSRKTGPGAKLGGPIAQDTSPS